MNAAIAASDGGTAVGDTITLVVWSLLLVFALRLLWVLAKPRRGAWHLVAIYCSVVVVDKAVDIQMLAYRAGCWCMHALDSWFGLNGHRSLVHVLVLVPMTTAAVGGTLWLARRDQYLDRGKQLALSGLVVVLLLVGLRMVPGLCEVLDQPVQWGVEGIACLMIGSGLWLAERDRSQVPG